MNIKAIDNGFLVSLLGSSQWGDNDKHYGFTTWDQVVEFVKNNQVVKETKDETPSTAA